MKTINTYETFQTFIKQPLTVIHAKTKQCNVCVSVGAQLESLIEAYPTVPFGQIFLEDIPVFQGQHLIFTVPTVVIFSKGKEILRESRFIDFKRIDRLLALYIDE